MELKRQQLEKCNKFKVFFELKFMWKGDKRNKLNIQTDREITNFNSNGHNV